MKSYNILTNRSDLIVDKSYVKINSNDNVLNYNDGNYLYKILYFNNLNNIEESLIKEISFFFKLLNIKKKNHLFVVGLGNDNHTADSIGPKTLKHIKVNSYLKNFFETDKTIISALEPGVLGETGILTEKIIKSVADLIKPDLIIVIDAIVSNNLDFLNKTIQITNAGINTGSGLYELSSNISYENLKIPTLVIGITTAIEVKFNNHTYLLSSKDIDDYVLKISKIIGNSINKAIDNLN